MNLKEINKMDELYFIKNNDNRLNSLVYLFFPYISQYDTWNIFDFERPQVGNFYCKNFDFVMTYQSSIFISGEEFIQKRVTINTDNRNEDNPYNPFWTYDGIIMSTVHNSKDVEILFLPVTTSSWSDPDLYVIPYYKDEIKNQSYWEFIKNKMEN
jgi:hypothetical protein